MASEPAFAIPDRPQRRYPYEGGVEYEGETVFRLQPRPPQSEESLDSLLRRVLAAGPYRYGDFFDLPMPLYLVRDDETGDVFRVSVRNGQIRFHVLPETESAGLRALYERLSDVWDVEWSVRCETTA
ncbi:hypothetical protein [Salinibaculum salinum]|uniref:hypothetical protein n=1 Tax=Salinibaculum salinum TaxID=3131996 RepID=UPI0030EE26E2